MNSSNTNFQFVDEGDLFYGKDEHLLSDIINVTYSGNMLAIKYDFSPDSSDDFSQLTVIQECNRNSCTWAERDLTHLYLELGVVVTDKALNTIIDQMKPEIDEFRKSYNDYYSGTSTLDFYELGEKYSALKELCAEHIESNGLGCQGMRSECETLANIYYADSDTLDFLVSPDMTNEEIKSFAIEELLSNGVLFHPNEIAGALMDHRDYQIDRRLELIEMIDDVTIKKSVQYLDAQEPSQCPDTQPQETRIRGIVLSECFMPDLQVSVRCSQAFICNQPSHRDYAEASDFEMAPDIKWDFIEQGGRGNPKISAWEKTELKEILRSNTDIAYLNPMGAVEG